MARTATPRLLGWPVVASAGAHVVAIVTASTVVALAPESVPPAPVPIEMVHVEAPAPPPPPPERPKPRRPEPKPQVQEKIVPPRLVTQPAELAQPTPLPAPALLDDTPRRETSAPAAVASDSAQRLFGGAAASSSWSMPAAAPSGPRAASKLFATGDLPIPSGRQGPGGSGTRVDGPAVASTGDATGLTSFARPLGGYQTRPRYPDSARREGVEGEALLRFQVLTNGRVAAVSVARSAGHPDLDRAAVDAVQSWLFEPARRGKEAVSVWVTLPVRFQLDARGEQ